VSVAMPLGFSVAVPSGVVPLRKVTVPVGSGAGCRRRVGGEHERLAGGQRGWNGGEVVV